MGRPTFLKLLAALAAPTLLAACGGGGGGKTAFAPTPVAFGVAPGKATAQGFGRSFTVQEGALARSSGMSGFSANQAVDLEISRDAAGVSGLALTAPGFEQSWSKADRQLSVDDGMIVGYRIAEGRAAAAVIASPEHQGFEHQTYGFWYDLPSTAGLNRFGVISAGAETAASDLPKSGKATFVGEAAGMHISGGEALDFRILRAQARIEADFANRTASFSTTGSSVGRDGSGAKISDSSLNMSGSLSAAADGRLSGRVSTAGGLSGSLDARFYGPGAAEIGGVFALSGSGVESLSGGFGAKRR